MLKVRLPGTAEDCAAAAGQLAAWTLDRSAPYPNRRDPGVRVYLTLLIPPGGAPDKSEQEMLSADVVMS